MKTRTLARWQIYLITWLTLSVVAAACTRLSPFHSPLPTQPGSALPTPTQPPRASLSSPPATPLAPTSPITLGSDHCRERPEGLDAALISFRLSPAGVSPVSGHSFCFTWRVSNTGTHPWPLGTMLVHVGGARLSAPARIPLSSVAPGSMVDITLQATAPPEEGHYTTYWQLVTPDGCPFGAVLYASFFVAPALDMPQPTEGPTPATATPMALGPTPTFEMPEFSVPGVCASPAARFEPVLRQAESLGLELGCVSSESQTAEARLQPFWRPLGEGNDSAALYSLVILREDAPHLIYVLEGRDPEAREAIPHTYEDTWKQSEPEIPPACAPLVPPPGFISPQRNIAKVWCEHSLWNSIGWPREAEISVTLTLQPMTHGLLMEAHAGDGRSWAVAIDNVQRSATIRRAAAP